MNLGTVQRISQRVKVAMEGFEPAHDFAHVLRVHKNAKQIHASEGGNGLVIELVSLLHEMGDPKFFDPSKSLPMVQNWLKEAGVDETTSLLIMSILPQVGFSKQLGNGQSPIVELHIVQDADRLEAIGAIGVARAFSYGASKQRPFFLENILPETFSDSVAYRQSQSPTVNHFFEKLFRLKDMMLTQTGKQLAEQRHKTMWQFLNCFFEEMAIEDPNSKKYWKKLMQTHK
ncbi:MAG: HD domain-containing protein [Breznakibacter sp.]